MENFRKDTRRILYTLTIGSLLTGTALVGYAAIRTLGDLEGSESVVYHWDTAKFAIGGGVASAMSGAFGKLANHLGSYQDNTQVPDNGQE
jgi:hypothetical protein